MTEVATNLAVAGKFVGGLLLGGVMAVFQPPLAIAIALVLLGVIGWSRWRGGDEAQPLTPFASGFVLAAAIYVALAVAAAVG